MPQGVIGILEHTRYATEVSETVKQPHLTFNGDGQPDAKRSYLRSFNQGHIPFVCDLSGRNPRYSPHRASATNTNRLVVTRLLAHDDSKTEGLFLRCSAMLLQNVIGT